MSGLSAQPTPPAEQTTASEPGTTSPEIAPARPERPELTPELGDGLHPRPSTLATQEIRLALAFTGGVSLAIWMGGVARELDLLVQASGRRRRIQDRDEVDPLTPDTDRVRRQYRRLLDLMDAEVAVDVLAGTSAGGINAALLGLVNARRLDLSKLRNIWLRAGDLGQLLRDPKEQGAPSLLKGDEQMLAELNRGIQQIVADQTAVEEPRKTDVFITTTLLSPETSKFSDDYGTQITDIDHHAQFRFDEESLLRGDIGAPLALAARSSASFPAAFEPSFVAFGDAPATATDTTHPDMSRYTNATRSHWAADGGLLVNRPIAPLLQSIFDRAADRQVRRTLLYIVPSSGLPDEPPDEEKDKPLGLADALLRDFGATLNQSIAADLAAIKEHNDRTRAAADTRLRLATLGAKLPMETPLADESAWQDYRERQGNWLVAPLITEVSRQLAVLGSAIPNAWQVVPGNDRDLTLRSAARTEATKSWRTDPPRDASAALDAAADLGRPALDSAKATAIRLLRLGYVLSTTVEDRNDLAKHGTEIHRAFTEPRRADLRESVKERVQQGAAGSVPLQDVVTQLAATYASAQGTKERLRAAWHAICATVDNAIPLLRRLATARAADDPADPHDGMSSLQQRQRLAAAELSRYLDFLERTDTVLQLLDLHVAVRSVLPVLLEVEQPVELIQVSADTRTRLAPNLGAAGAKLTGMQVHHFGAFYKTSWRANDWMWGRLDGCGWLVHMLLDPRRMLTVMENDGVPLGSRADAFAASLATALDLESPLPEKEREDLAFLDKDPTTLPTSLPHLTLWVAEALQQHILAEELPIVATHVRSALQDNASAEAVTWLAEFDGTDWQKKGSAPERHVLASLLTKCPVASESLKQEARTRTPLYLRTVTHAVAVATSAATGLKNPPSSLRPTFATARAVTQTAYVATDRTDGRRSKMTLVGLGLLAVGLLAMLTDIVVLGLTGLVAFGAGAVLLAFCLGPKTVGALKLLLALALILLACAPWLPWLDQRIFSWLDETAIPWIDDHQWAWPVLLFLVLLPAMLAPGDLAKRFHRQQPRTRSTS